MASGDTLLIFTPACNEPPATNPATYNARNGHPVLEFDKDTSEIAIFTTVMPRHYAGGGLTIYLHWAAATSTSGTIGWLVDLERIGDGSQDTDSDGFTGSANTVTAATVPATSGNVKITNCTFTNGADMDSIAAGEAFRIKIARDVDNDTADSDAQLFAVEIKES